MNRENQLAANEILVNGDIHQLVPGYTEWSIKEYHGETWRDRSVFLYYKNYVTVHLLRQKQAYVEYDNKQKFKTLQEVVATFQQYSLIASFEKWNQEKGIEGDAWCQKRGTPIRTISITLPLATIEALQKHVSPETLSHWIEERIHQQLYSSEPPSLQEKKARPQKRVRLRV